MIRQVLFTVLVVWLPLGPLATSRAQTPPQPSPARPPTELPFSAVKPDAVFAIPMEPGSTMTADAGWVRGGAGGVVTRLDPKTNTAGPPLPAGPAPCASLSAAFGSIWVPLCGDTPGIARIDIATGKVALTLPLTVTGPKGTTATAVGSVWVLTDRKGVLSRIDPDTNAAVAETHVAAGAEAVAAGDDALWVTSGPSGTLTRVNPHTNEVVEIVKVGTNPGRLAVGEGAVWTLNQGDGTVSRVDPKTNKVVATIAVGEVCATGELAVGEGSVWISAPGVPITRIDPRTNRAVQRFTGEGGGAILVAHGSLWVASGPKQMSRLDPTLVATLRP